MSNAIKSSFDYVVRIDRSSDVPKLNLYRKCGSPCFCYRGAHKCTTSCAMFVVRTCDVVSNKCNVTFGCSSLGQSFVMEIEDDSEKAPM